MTGDRTSPDARRPGRTAWVIALLALALTAWIFTRSKTPFAGYDWLELQAFNKHHYREAVFAGRLPLWNPHVAFGRPFLADIETATLYPPNLVFLLPENAALPLSVALHVALLLGGAWLLGRDLGLRPGASLLAGITLALGAAFSGRLQAGQLQVFCTLAHLPLWWVCAWRAWRAPSFGAVAIFGLVTAHAILAGSPPFLWAIAFAIGCWLLAWGAAGTRADLFRGLGAVMLGGGIGLGLTAVQLLPFAELLGQGNRAAHSPEFAALGALPLRNLASLLVPSLPARPFYWEMNLFAGVLAPVGVLLVAAAWRDRAARALVVVALASLLLALPLGLTSALAWVPGLGALRLPSRYALVVGWSLVLVALLVWERRGGGRAWLPYAAGGLQVGFLLWAVHVQATGYANGSTPEAESQIAAEAERRAATLPAGPLRTALARDAVRANAGVAHGFSNLDSFANPGLARFWGATHALAGIAPRPGDFTSSAGLALQPRAALQRWGVQFGWDTDRGTFFFAPEAGPLAQAVFASSTATSPAAAAQGWWREPEQVWLETGADAGSASAPAAAPHALVIERSAPESREVRWRAESPGWLLLADPWYPDWIAQTPAGAQAVVPANGWMRAVALPAGDFSVRFEYRPHSLRIGAAISVLTALGLGAWWLVRRRCATRLASP